MNNGPIYQQLDSLNSDTAEDEVTAVMSASSRLGTTLLTKLRKRGCPGVLGACEADCHTTDPQRRLDSSVPLITNDVSLYQGCGPDIC